MADNPISVIVRRAASGSAVSAAACRDALTFAFRDRDSEVSAAIMAALVAFCNLTTTTAAMNNAINDCCDAMFASARAPAAAAIAIPDNIANDHGLLAAFATHVLLPAFYATGHAAAAPATAATINPENTARTYALSLVSPTGVATASFISILQQIKHDQPIAKSKFPAALRENLQRTIFERLAAACGAEPQFLAAIKSGLPLQGEFAASAFSVRAFRRLALTVAAPLVAAQLYRVHTLTPSINSIDAVLMCATATFPAEKEKTPLGQKRPRD